MFKAVVRVTLRPSILDPQGKATKQALSQLGFEAVQQVRIGKYIELWIDEGDEAVARGVAEEACRKLLANPVVENYEVEMEQAGVSA